jgi:hypothetical protein
MLTELINLRGLLAPMAWSNAALRRQQSYDDSMLGGHGGPTPLEHGCQGLLVVFCCDEVLQTSQVDCIRKDKLEFAYQMSFDRGPGWERVHGVTS